MHTRSRVSAIFAVAMLTSAGLTQAAPILDSKFKADSLQHRVWAVPDRALNGADNPSVPESILLQLYRPATTSDPADDSIMAAASFLALDAAVTGSAEPALATTLLSEPAPFALLVAALGGLFLRRRS